MNNNLHSWSPARRQERQVANAGNKMVSKGPFHYYYNSYIVSPSHYILSSMTSKPTIFLVFTYSTILTNFSNHNYNILP
eukprot:11919016-Karenia_brevis.AAC.1